MSDIHRRPAAALALAAALAVPAKAEAPGDPRIEAFRATCVAGAGDYAGTQRIAVAEGWRAAEGSEHRSLAAMLEAAAREVELDPGMALSRSVYGKEVDGRPLFLVTVLVTSDYIDILGCNLYDFDATEPLGQQLFNGWLGEPPHTVVDEPGTLIGQSWDTPASLPGVWDVHNGFVPAGSPLAAKAGFSGLTLAMDSVQPKKRVVAPGEPGR